MPGGDDRFDHRSSARTLRISSLRGWLEDVGLPTLKRSELEIILRPARILQGDISPVRMFGKIYGMKKCLRKKNYVSRICFNDVCRNF